MQNRGPQGHLTDPWRNENWIMSTSKKVQNLVRQQNNKSIAKLLARNRARNDASNRAEFLHPSKRHHTSDGYGDPPSNEGDEIEHASCARTDAKPTDRDVMMKFDIAKNEEGPLRRTLKVEAKDGDKMPSDKSVEGDSLVTASRHPGLDERLKNLETHLAMRYGTFVLSHSALNLMELCKCRRLQRHYFTVSNASKIISFNSSATTLLGLLCTLINLVVVYVVHYPTCYRVPCLTCLC